MRARERTPAAPWGDGVITSLVVRSRRPDRIAVHLDGAFAFDLAAVVADQAGLRIGDVLTAETQEWLLREDAPHRARSRALRLLALRDRSQWQVETRLRTSGFEPQVVAETIAWLTGLGYLDDGRFVGRYATERLKAGWGRRRIRADLLQKGVDRALVDDALGTGGVDSRSVDSLAAGERDDALLALARRRFGEQFASDPDTAERRLAGFLARRGHDWEVIARMARVLRGEAGHEAGGEAGLP